MNGASGFARQKELFTAALALPADERGGFLDRCCGGDGELRASITALLAHHAEPAPEINALSILLAAARSPEPDPMPERVGCYRLLHKLGEGGTGIVFAATQECPQRPVAVKLLRLAAATRRATRRFQHEAEFLARLNHPGIAHVYEAGFADLPWGRQAFIAMELVHGAPLTEYAAKQGLSLRDRLALFAKVCDAVEYAHTRGIVHRDLKPSNILVGSDAQPKVLDFGVARAASGDLAGTLTGACELIGTLPYMSPEQAEGRRGLAGPGGDIYSLGALLYELVSGEVPVPVKDLSLAEAIRHLREGLVVPLRRVAPGCPGDVDLIITKALAADPRHRYPSAAALADDLRRYLAHEPVSARPPTLVYVASRLVRRHRPFAAAAAAGALVLVVVGVLAVRQDIRTRRDAQTLRFALGLFEQMVTARHETFGPQERAVFPSRLVQMSEDVQSQLSDRPVLQASVLASIAKCLAFTYGRYAEAEPILRRALALIEANSDNPRQRRRMLYTWTIIAAEVGVLKDPAKTYRSLIAEADREGENDEQVMRVLITLTWALLQSEQAETAQQALGDLRRHLATQPEALQAKLAEQVVAIEAYSLLLAHHPEQAERLLPGCDALLKGPGPDREHWYQLVQSQAMIQGAMGRRSRARELWECLLVETQRCQGAGSRQVMTARRNIAGLAWLDRDLVTAERMFGELAASAQATQPPDNKTLAEALNSRGVCLRDMARYDEAEPLLKEALRQRIKMMGGESPRVAETRINLATLYLRSGRAADALREADEAYLLNKNLSGENHHNSIESLAVVGMARSALAGPAAGLADLTEAYRRRVDGGLMADWRTDVAVDALVGALESVGRAADALALLEKEYTALHDSLGEHNAITLRASARLQKRKQLSATETVAP